MFRQPTDYSLFGRPFLGSTRTTKHLRRARAGGHAQRIVVFGLCIRRQIYCRWFSSVRAAPRAAGSLRSPDIVAVSTRFVRWIDRFEWDHPRPARGRRGEGRRARSTHTHGHAHARALLRLVPANISATPEGSDGNSKCRDPHRSVRARGLTHTPHAPRREGMASEGKAICSLQASAR